MTTVTLSPKYQIAIPKSIRRMRQIRPGVQFSVFEIGGRIKLVPVPPKRQWRGFLKGIDLPFAREKEDRPL